jgi:hypothetical protein
LIETFIESYPNVCVTSNCFMNPECDGKDHLVQPRRTG